MAKPADTEGLRQQGTVSFTYDGKPVRAAPNDTILQAARRAGFHIPKLCYQEGYRPDGNCRACVVEIEGERVLAPSCWRRPTEGMKVRGDSERSLHSRRLVLELLLSDMPEQGRSPYTRDSELDYWAERLGVSHPRFPGRQQSPAADVSNPAIEVNLDVCIQCNRCVRACREEQANDVIGYAFRGERSEIVFDMRDAMGKSTCVSCGECVQACPTGALMPAGKEAKQQEERKVDSVCPYCGVGCLLRYHVREDRILRVSGRDGPSNHGRLCVKGRYGFDYVHHEQRLIRPLIRRQGVAKTADLVPPARVLEHFREATWEEALDRAAGGLVEIRDQHGGQALAGFGSAKGSNEEAYLFQKLVRMGFGTNNVDHCTRLCHASSVAALLECIGSGAVSNPVADVAETDVLLVIGARPTVNHPVAATFMKNAAKAGKTLILIDPYRSDLARYARHFLQFRPDTDVTLLNGIMHIVLAEGLHNERFIREKTTGFEEFAHNLKAYTPQRVSRVCGVPEKKLYEVARCYASAPAAMIFWGMGISQHIHGTDNARCLISLALLTGQIGRAGTGLHPLRGQNNVQGASDVGLIPMMYPDYQLVGDAETRRKFERHWGAALPSEPGLTVVEIMDAVHAGQIRGMYIMGENPAMSDPNLQHAREALRKLRHLVVQDIFFTETAGFADVILPASAFPEKTGTFTNTDRRVQLGRKAIATPGEACEDLWIIQQIAQRLGLDWEYTGPQQVFEEICRVTPSIAGMTWERLEREDSLTYPLCKEGENGQSTLFSQSFPTPNGKGKFVSAIQREADEMPDDDYPWVFTTGRYLEHWHTGSMTRRSRALNAIEPEPVANLHPEDLRQIGAAPGDRICIESRRGKIEAIARADAGMQQGNVFMAFCFREAAANMLTNPALDPSGKIPEFKYCAVHLAPASASAKQPSARRRRRATMATSQ